MKGRRQQVQTEDTSISITPEGLKINSDNNVAIYLIIGVIAFFIYAKYFHKPVIKKIRRRKK